jgi:hypothetical protein
VPRLCCRARHMTPCAGIGYGEKVSRRLWSKKEVEEGIGLTAKHRDTERPANFARNWQNCQYRASTNNGALRRYRNLKSRAKDRRQNVIG